MSDNVTVKFDKAGGNKMEYKKRVPDFNTFIKSPDKFTKGQTIKASPDGVTAKPGDKDYKQLLAKVKMFSEQLTTETDLTKIGAISVELAKVNEELSQAIQSEVTGGSDEKKKLSDDLGKAIHDFLNREPAKAQELSAELDKLGSTPEEVKEKVLQETSPNEQKTQELIDALQDTQGAQTKLAQAMEMAVPVEDESVKKKNFDSVLHKLMMGSSIAGVSALALGGILYTMTGGDYSVLGGAIAAAGGISMLVATVASVAKSILKGEWRTKQ